MLAAAEGATASMVRTSTSVPSLRGMPTGTDSDGATAAGSRGTTLDGGGTVRGGNEGSGVGSSGARLVSSASPSV